MALLRQEEGVGAEFEGLDHLAAAVEDEAQLVVGHEPAAVFGARLAGTEAAGRFAGPGKAAVRVEHHVGVGGHAEAVGILAVGMAVAAGQTGIHLALA